MPLQCERLAQLTWWAAAVPNHELYLMINDDAVSLTTKEMIVAALTVAGEVKHPVAAARVAKGLCLGRKHKRSILIDINLNDKWLDS